MSNKLFLDNQDVPYEPSESEDELSEGEKEILKEVRQGKNRKTDSKHEILAFDESADSDDAQDADDADDIIGDSDIERGDENDGIPDSKAWGKQRRSYYNTDFVDQDYSAYNEQEEEQAQQEEEEAKAIQLRLAKQLDEADFFLDMPTGAGSDSDDDEEDTTLKSKSKKTEKSTKLKSDLSNMSQREIQQLFKKDSPEFAGLVEDFQTYLEESRTILTPVIQFADEQQIHLPIFDFVRTRDNMIMSYCTNVAFYLLLKSERISIKNHPITKRLVTLKKLINQVQQKYEDIVKPQLEELLERIENGALIDIDVSPVKKEEKSKKKKLRMMKEFNSEGEEEEDDSGEEYEEAPSSKRVKMSNEGSTDDEDDDKEEGEEDEENLEEDEAERRGITYQIAKNKGLMPHRKKELRNPRVKHRGKFRKALIRRKGAVRTVRKEIQRYGGEVSGIKATTKKGIKIKS
ncbi:something about silencing protein 10 [Episyrphus balteatus]|uniref:something about silencing protein 10 n=1 Tax=Episyrphus balteatus TaxID=286459 RepID=UPI00248659E5|nr:something about silencing protein 10 [Episyrphus balteatus]